MNSAIKDFPHFTENPDEKELNRNWEKLFQVLYPFAIKKTLKMTNIADEDSAMEMVTKAMVEFKKRYPILVKRSADQILAFCLKVMNNCLYDILRSRKANKYIYGRTKHHDVLEVGIEVKLAEEEIQIIEKRQQALKVVNVIDQYAKDNKKERIWEILKQNCIDEHTYIVLANGDKGKADVLKTNSSRFKKSILNNFQLSSSGEIEPK